LRGRIGLLNRSHNDRLDEGKPVSLQEVMVSALAMTDALAKLLIEKGIITDAEP